MAGFLAQKKDMLSLGMYSLGGLGASLTVGASAATRITATLAKETLKTAAEAFLKTLLKSAIMGGVNITRSQALKVALLKGVQKAVINPIVNIGTQTVLSHRQVFS